MKSRLLKILILVFCVSFALFAISCGGDMIVSQESEQQSEIISSEESSNASVEETTSSVESEIESEHICNYTKLQFNSTHHWYECDCGEKGEEQAHAGGTATCTQKAVCTTCSQAYGSTLAHSYTELKYNSTHHWYECTCGEKGEEQAHAGGTATCTQKAICTTCSQSYGDLLAHNYTELKYNSTHHWYECTCGEKDSSTEQAHAGGTATCTQKAVCTTCSQSYGDLLAHNYTELKYNSTHHWYECTCGEKDSSTEQAHAGGTATCTEKAVCSSCGQEYGATLSHVYTELKYNSTHHWYECTCGEKGEEQAHAGGTATCTQKAVCTTCSQAYGNLLAHSYTELKYNSTHHWYECTCGAKDSSTEQVHAGGTATCTQKAVCTTCSQAYGSTLAHSYTELKYNSTHHWYECACGDVLYDDYANLIHRGGTATCQDLAVCVVCGQEYGELGNHRGGTATCQDLAVCTTCGQGYGELGNHRGGTATCQELAECTTCGQSYGSYGAHIGGEATCQELAECTTCGQSYGSYGEHNMVDGVCSICGVEESNGLTYELSEDGSYYTVTGIGSCKDLDLIIPSKYKDLPIKEIGTSAFEDCDSLNSVKIPDSVTTIGSYAFAYCHGLKRVVIGEGVTYIGSSAFDYCYNLTSVKIGNSVTTIGVSAFEDCYSLSSVEIPDSVISIGSSAFDFCHNLTSVVIGDSVTTIGSYAFDFCYNLTSVVIGESVTKIGSYAFDCCYKLVEVINKSANITVTKGSSSNGYVGRYALSVSNCDSSYVSKLTNDNGYIVYTEGSNKILVGYSGTETDLVIPDYITEINNRAFAYCDSLTSIVIPDSVTTIGERAFFGCVAEIIWGDNTTITIICEYAFYGYKGTSITIPDSVTTIGGRAFQYCDSLTSVEIGNSVTTIGSEAFYNCSMLTSVVIGDSVTTIGDYAFYNCYKLVEVINNSTHITITRGSSNGYVGYSALSISNCDSSYVSKVTNDNGYIVYTEGSNKILVGYSGTETDLVIPDYITEINRYAFYNSDSLTSVVIGDSVTTIGSDAFCNCTSLTSVEIPDSVTTIGASAFGGCINLQSITLPFVGGSKNATTASASTLFGYIFGTSIYTGSTEVKQYYKSGSSATYYIPTSLTQVTITGGKILYGAFYNLESLTSVVIGDGVTSIGDYAFYNCDSLTSVVIGDNVTSIGEEAFRGCDSLTSVEIPDSVTSIGNYAFASCDSLISVEIGDSVTSIGYEAFYNCGSLTSVEIPDSVTSIGWGAFEYCYSLTSVVIPDSVTSIGYRAFYDCDSLTSIEVGENNTSYKSIDGNLYSKDGTELIQYAIGKTDSEFIIPNSVTSIGSSAFSWCGSLTSVVIGDGVTSIGDWAFSSCYSLTSVYYKGTSSEWSSISKGSYNEVLTSATRYYYIENEADVPTDGGNYWHYDENGNVAIW